MDSAAWTRFANPGIDAAQVGSHVDSESKCDKPASLHIGASFNISNSSLP